MPKQNGQPKPAHRPARRKTKPKFDVPAGVGEPAAAGWVYREEPPEMVVETPVETAAAAISETIAAPIAGMIAATAAIEPEPIRAAPRATGPFVATAREPINEGSREESFSPIRSATMSLFGMGLGVMQLFVTTAMTLATAPVSIARRLILRG